MKTVMTMWGGLKNGRFWPGAMLVAVCLVYLALPSALADNFFQGFAAAGALKTGSIAAISTGSSSAAVPAPAGDSDRIYGVVIDPADATITLNRPSQEVFVATSGNFPVLVSNEAGNINVGDYISVSDTDGIGAKAGTNQDYVLGQALQSFDGTKNLVSGIAAGPAAVGTITVAINPGKNPLLANQLALPGPLRRAGEAIAGHTVSAARVWAALAVFLVASAISAIFLSNGVRSAITAIGRNPLSRHTILNGLFQVVAASVIIFIVGLIAVYLLLRI